MATGAGGAAGDQSGAADTCHGWPASAGAEGAEGVGCAIGVGAGARALAARGAPAGGPGRGGGLESAAAVRWGYGSSYRGCSQPCRKLGKLNSVSRIGLALRMFTSWNHIK